MDPLLYFTDLRYLPFQFMAKIRSRGKRIRASCAWIAHVKTIFPIENTIFATPLRESKK